MLFQLQQAVKSNLIAHAYLFLGPGEKTLANAFAFAQALNCASPVDGQGCQTCLSCRKIAHGNHPDVAIAEPLDGSFKIEQTRELQKKINFKHFEGKYKVLILTGADLMSIAAGNSMLKTLEEPPVNTILILTAENGDNILPTILSRCQMIKFGEGADFKKDLEVDPDEWVGIVSLVRNLPHLDYAQLLGEVDVWVKDREKTQRRLVTMLILFRDMMVARLAGRSDVGDILATKNNWTFLDDCNYPPEVALRAAIEVAQSQKLISKNVNLRLVLDVMFIHLQQICR